MLSNQRASPHKGVHKPDSSASFPRPSFGPLPQGEPQVPTLALGDLVPGQQLVCHVLEAGEDALWLGAGPAVRGRCAALDASLDPDALTNLATAFPPGTPVVARVVAVAAKKQHPTLDLSLIDPCSGTTHGSVAGAAAHPEGSLAMGKVLGVAGTGVRLSLGTKRAAKVAVTDIHDVWVEDALAGIKEGLYVRCRVVGKDGETAVASLRPSKGGAVAGRKAEVGKERGKDKGGKGKEAAQGEKAPELVDVGKLAAGQEVCGYVKRCDAKGLFVALDRWGGARRGGRGLRVAWASSVEGYPGQCRGHAASPAVRWPACNLGNTELSCPFPTPRPCSHPPTGPAGQSSTGRTRLRDPSVPLSLDQLLSCPFPSRFRDARVKLGNLSDGFIEDPAAAFPPGMRVKARVLKVDDDGRVDLTFRWAPHWAGGIRKGRRGVMCPVRTGAVPRWSRQECQCVRYGLSIGYGRCPGTATHPFGPLGITYTCTSGVRTWCDPCCRPAPRSPRAKPSGSRVQSLAELKVGQVVAGRVRRAEKFGVFVEVRAGANGGEGRGT